jgi:hypothetical protein
MKKDSNATSEMPTLDKEWLVLILAAKEFGISKQEVLAFLRRGNLTSASQMI